MYEVLFVENAECELKKLEKEMQKRVVATLERARIRPEAFFSRLVGEKAYKLRIEDCRLIADIKQAELIILVIKASHGKKVYKK